MSNEMKGEGEGERENLLFRLGVEISEKKILC